jgi:transglutaminase-like putative cysteine protease
MAALPVVLLELLHRVRAAGPLQAQLVDLASAETMPVRVERRGPEIVVLDEGGFVVARALPEGDRVGPGAFAEGDAPPSLASPPIELPVPGRVTVRGLSLPRAARWVAPPDNAPSGAEDRAPAPFLESDAGAVVDFARPLCHADVAETSRRVLEAVHPRVDAQTTNEPPSALAMLAHGGDCDGAAALVVALLRACGWSARPVVGYRLVDSGRPLARLVPHALAEVYTSTGWMRVDATVPAMGALDDVFIPIATGLGGALTMGRVLGVLDANDLVARSAPAKAPPPGPGISPSQGIEAPGTP